MGIVGYLWFPLELLVGLPGVSEQLLHLRGAVELGVDPHPHHVRPLLPAHLRKIFDETEKYLMKQKNISASGYTSWSPDPDHSISLPMYLNAATTNSLQIAKLVFLDLIWILSQLDVDITHLDICSVDPGKSDNWTLYCTIDTALPLQLCATVLCHYLLKKFIAFTKFK